MLKSLREILIHLLSRRKKENVMASIFDVAAFIIGQKGSVTGWELQKLCYYCKAWDIAVEGRIMFPEPFEAWSDGPANRNLYNAHRGQRHIHKWQIHDGNPSNIRPQDRDVILAVLEQYKDFTGDDLRRKTHGEQPWIAARNGLPETASCSAEITDKEIDEYYSQSNERKDMERLIKKQQILRMGTPYKEEYTLPEACELLGITLEDINTAEELEIDYS